MMFLGLIFAVCVAVLWAQGEISYSRLSRNLDRANVYFYQYFTRAVLYLLVVIVMDIGLFTRFDFNHLLVFLPIIMCDLFASYVVNISVANGKLSVVSPIMAAYPIVDILLGIMLLKEKIGGPEIALSIIIAISIVILAVSQRKSKASPHPFKGISFACVYMLLTAFSVFFEKNAYIDNFQVSELYYYKGLIYMLTSGVFMLVIGVTPVKLKKPDINILKGTGITPIGNVLNSFALSFTNMIIVTPISSLYSVISNYLSRKVLKEKLSIRERICIGLILASTITLIVIGII